MPTRRRARFLAVILGALVVFSLVSGATPPAEAQTTDYDSDDDGLIEVSTPAQLYAIRYDTDGDGTAYVDGHWGAYYYDQFTNTPTDRDMGCPDSGCVGYELAKDLDMNGFHIFWPISGFSATFEGNGHTIANLRAKHGMFGDITASGVVRNLTLKSLGVSGRQNAVGGLAGVNHGTISNVHVSGGVGTDSEKPLGGLVGLNGPTGVIADSSSAGRITDSSVTDISRNIGGLVGRNEGSIRSSYAAARLWGYQSSNMGGLVGYNAATGSILASYATGEVWSRYTHGRGKPYGRHLGGLVGDNHGDITASYSTGRARGGEVMGGLVGRNTGGTITDSYWDSQTSGWTSSAGGLRKRTEELQQPWTYQGIYANWNVDLDGGGSPDDPWDFGSITEYPTLKAPEDRHQDAMVYGVPARVEALEGRAVRLTITLGEAAPAGGVAFTVTPTYGGSATAAHVGSITSPVTVLQGNSTLEISIPTVNDFSADGRRTFTLTVAAVTSGWRKAGDGRDTAVVTIRDDDSAGIRLVTSGPNRRLGDPLRITEGGTATFEVSLSSLPRSNVAVTPTSDDAGAVTVSPASRTWTPSDWRTLKTFTVTGAADADTRDESVDIRLSASSQDWRFNRAFVGIVRVAVSDNTTTGQPQTSPQQQPQTSGDYADLIDQMYEWRSDPQWASYKSHTDRWDRALKAFGETVADDSLSAMTAAEAQAFADSGMTRWVGVAEALRALEAREGGTPVPHERAQPLQERQLVPPAHHADLLAQMDGWRNDPQWVSYKSHTDRWDRALLAFGEPVSDTSLSPMTDSEAQDFADTAWGTRWVGVAAALKAVVTGTSGADTLTGTGSGELLVGLGGADTLNGQGGNDELRGGGGNDSLTGGGGADRFVFFSGETGANTLTDFASGDVIVLAGSGWSSVSDIIASVQGVGSGNYRYTLASGLTVETTNNRALRTEDFLAE